jgi:hypothetical protein
MSGLIFRLPTYFLPVVMGVIEWSLRRALNQPAVTNFLPAAIVSAGLGMLSSIVVNDLTPQVLRSLSVSRQEILRMISGVSFIWMLTGLALWFELAVSMTKQANTLGLPYFSLLSLNVPLSYAALFYILSLGLNEIKAGVSS